MALDFYMSVKSTIDYLASEIARDLEVAATIDLDDRVNVQDAESRNKTAVVWQLGNFKESPRDPLYELVFGLGIRTANDPGNYELTRLISAQENRVRVNSEIPIADYSGYDMPEVHDGWFFVKSSTVNQTQFDEMSNVRLIEISAVGCRTR